MLILLTTIISLLRSNHGVSNIIRHYSPVYLTQLDKGTTELASLLERAYQSAMIHSLPDLLLRRTSQYMSKGESLQLNRPCVSA